MNEAPRDARSAARGAKRPGATRALTGRDAANFGWRRWWRGVSPLTRRSLGFFASFGLLLAVYFAATLDLKLQNPDGAGSHPITAGLAATNQWVRRTLLEPYQRGIATVVASLLDTIGHEAKAHGREIRSLDFAVVITSGCDAIEPSLLLGAAMLCFPAAKRAKLAGFLAGVAAIAALNVVRVVTLWVIGRHWRGAFDVAHFTIWPFLIILFTVGIFVAWLRWAVHSPRMVPALAA